LFGLPAGESVTGKMVAALRRIGFDQVFDTNFAADVTVIEESTEFLHRLKNGGKLPIITSCCPSWVKFIEHQYPELLDYPSSCKSPQEMLGALIKTWLAEKKGIDPANIVSVAIMPCLAKKYEAKREELRNNGLANVDYVLSTREFSRIIKEAGILFADLPEEDFDPLMGESTGAANIFGTAGGILEAVLRTACEVMLDKKLDKLEFEGLRGFSKNVKEASINLDGTLVRVAVANELRQARQLMEEIREGKSEYHAIEITACPGGCITGGGQPYHYASEELLNKRREALYREDRQKMLRCSHENAGVKKLYEEFLGEPYGQKAKDLLHTEYIKRTVYNE
jgi:NADH-quinone oxidoreductase subunit G